MDTKHSAVAVGASAGGVGALLELAAAMPPKFPAAVFVTQHIGNNPSILPELMRARGPNHAMHPHDGDLPLPGTIYIAPPDHHMLVEEARIRLLRGPKENHARPAIDPMFRSIALAYGSRAIGVVLTGHLDDGTAGLRAIKQCGGMAIVQEPATALEPSMPLSALANVEVDLRLRVGEIVPAVVKALANQRAQRNGSGPPEALQREQAIFHGRQGMENLNAIGKPSGLSCPDCGGGLWELNDDKPLRFRCHTGHAFSSLSLEHAMTGNAEQSMWSSVRSLQEREMLLRRVAMVARAQGDQAQAQAAELNSRQAREQAAQLVQMIEERERRSA